jgi:hypothetical protein
MIERIRKVVAGADRPGGSGLPPDVERERREGGVRDEVAT